MKWLQLFRKEEKEKEPKDTCDHHMHYRGTYKVRHKTPISNCREPDEIAYYLSKEIVDEYKFTRDVMTLKSVYGCCKCEKKEIRTRFETASPFNMKEFEDYPGEEI